jgi:acetoacetyl-CoA synthetase
MDFAQLPFDHPLFVMYSSGTTGKPKAIVHGAGGTLLKHLEEHRVHCDLVRSSRIFYATTTGWMMWNWLVGALASGCAVLLAEGAAFHPDPGRLWRYAVDQRITHFGTSAGYLDALRKADYAPGERHDLGALQTVLSTGSPLSEESFRWVYRAVKADLHLASISGGTDIISCFALGCSALPVYAGQLQVRGLGMAVDAWDPDGQPVRGATGELVCTEAFPSMPIGFWDDPDDARYRAAYFDVWPDVWRHGDWVRIEATGGLRMLGRSDATLNPGGVRIGTAEIYRIVDRHPDVVESLVVGREQGDDVRVLLFLVLRAGAALDEAMAADLRARIRSEASPRHVPAGIHAAPAIPRTISGKTVELAVREVLHGRPVSNTAALANPEALDWFRAFAGEQKD